MNSVFNRKIAWLSAFVLIQSFQILAMAFHNYYSYSGMLISYPMAKSLSMLILAVGTILAGSSLWFIHQIQDLADKQAEAETQVVLMEESREMINILRAKQHDYSNHLQVISGSLQMGKPQRAMEYIKEIVGDLSLASNITGLESPELAALLLKKISLAEANGILVKLSIESRLTSFPFSAYELTRILGNLLDNAIYALSEDFAPKKILLIWISEDLSHYLFRITNSSPVIPDSLHDAIFQEGFTTKGDKGSGLGLAIVKALVEKHKGRIELISNEQEGTVYTVILPKNPGA